MRLSFYLPPQSYTTALWNIAGLWHWDVGFECPSQSLLYIIETHQYLSQRSGLCVGKSDTTQLRRDVSVLGVVE